MILDKVNEAPSGASFEEYNMLIVLTLKSEDREGHPGKIIYFQYPVSHLSEFEKILNDRDFVCGQQMFYEPDPITGKRLWKHKKDFIVQSTEIKNCSNFIER